MRQLICTNVYTVADPEWEGVCQKFKGEVYGTNQNMPSLQIR